MGWFSRAVNAASRALGVNNNNNNAPKPMPQMGPGGDKMESDADKARRLARTRGKQVKGRGRDSTIITSNSETGSRTLLG